MLALVFPGQGSQKPGMGSSWKNCSSWSIVEEISSHTKINLDHLLLEASAEELTSTENAQIATFTLSVVIFNELKNTKNILFSATAGHSLGEYSALTAAGVLDLTDAAQIVAERGHSMKEAANQRTGTMMAVLGLEEELVKKACEEINKEAWIANVNCPGQIVISGNIDDLNQVAELAKQLGAKRVVKLPVGGAFHTPFMEQAQNRLDKVISDVSFFDSAIPVVANVDAQTHTQANDWKKLCSLQLTSPVLWKQSFEELASLGITTVIEVGPGNVLTGLAKKINPDIKAISVFEQLDMEKITY